MGFFGRKNKSSQGKKPIGSRSSGEELHDKDANFSATCSGDASYSDGAIAS